MRKFTFVLIMMLGFASLGIAQTIEDYENIKMNLFSQGTTGSIAVVPNPDATGANTSAYVCKMVISKAGRDPWAGWYCPLTDSVDVDATHYVHLKIWKPRVSPVDFKLEQGSDVGNTGDIYPISDPGTTNAWVELVFDYSDFTGKFRQIVLIPDFENPYNGTEDVTLYFDDMYVNDDPTVGSAPVRVLEDFEPGITMNLFAQGTTGTIGVIDNPDKSGINLTSRVAQMVRAKDGDPWQGWYSPITVPVTPANTRYAHVKVWKPRISPVCFKLEQGTGSSAGTGDVFSVNEQTVVNGWQDMVFDYGDFDGDFFQIVLIPDFENPLTITEDFTMYFDEIKVNNDPNPATPPVQILQVNMGGAGLNPGDKVFISGTLGGVYGTWVEPGSVAANEMTDPDGDGIYTIALSLPDGAYQFKFFIVPVTEADGKTWDYGDNAVPDRTYTFAGDANLIYVWGEPGFEVSVREKPLAGKIVMYPNPAGDILNVNSTADLRKVTITSMVGKVVGVYSISSGLHTLNTSNLSKGMYFITFIGKDGTKVTQKLIKD